VLLSPLIWRCPRIVFALLRSDCSCATVCDYSVFNCRGYDGIFRGTHETSNHPHGRNAAEKVELMHQNDAIVAQNHVSNIYDTGTPAARDMNPAQLAQTHAWDTPFVTDAFSSRNQYPSCIPTKRDARCPPPNVTQSAKASRQRSYRAQVGSSSRGPVLPLVMPIGASHIPCRIRSYAEFSPRSPPVQPP
jgi:hypothetical protein